MPTAETPHFQTKELSIETWADLERLFQKPEFGDAWWCWCTYHQVSSKTRPYNSQPRTRKERAVKNHHEKRALVENDRAHGIIVYSGTDPVGWCQFGVRDELPRIDSSRNYRKAVEVAAERLWRITCFVVDKKFRKRGVATAALNGALGAIAKKGGGVVEATPVRKTDQGPGYMYTGTVSMFKRVGFKTVGPFGSGRTTSVLMRKRV